jgi:beta-N-acetylhexosaminidase
MKWQPSRMASLEIVRQAASLFVVGFPGAAPDRELEALIDLGISGAILFKRNIESPAQTLALNRELKKRANRNFLCAVDQEGGRVARLRGAPFTALPPMRELARGGIAAAEMAGTVLAREVRAVGFDWDFAPVLDVDTNPANPVIGDRSFSREPATVSELGIALARAMEAEGVASCGKHFPGHGDTLQDSHKDLPRLPHGLPRLREVELPPFKAYARANLASIMTAHVVFEALDPEVPATMSRKVLHGLLREELGFGGVVVSDDMEMKAVADNFDLPKACVQALAAGVDLFLVCHHAAVQRACIEGVAAAVESGALPRARFDDARERVRMLAVRFAQGPETGGLEALESPEHQALASKLLHAGDAGHDPTERA